MAKAKKVTAVFQGTTAKGQRRYNIERGAGRPFGSIYLDPNKVLDQVTVVFDHGDEDEEDEDDD